MREAWPGAAITTAIAAMRLLACGEDGWQTTPHIKDRTKQSKTHTHRDTHTTHCNP